MKGKSFWFMMPWLLLLASCKNNEDTTMPVSNTIQLVATLNGQQEKPTPNASMATGTFTGSLDRASRVLSYTITYSGLTPTAGHLHRIDTRKSDGTGPVDIPFGISGQGITSPFSGTAGPLTQVKIDSIINGYYYANLRTTAYPNGEIRGDVRIN